MSQLLLAVDTSGKNGNVALARVTAGRADVEIVESVPLAGGTFSAQLIPQISALLDKHGFSKKDLAAFAAVSGPGSFTGLRVGLAAIKGLAEGLQKRIATVSLLEAVARSGRAGGSVLAALDAGRTEVYVGDYEIGAEGCDTHAHIRSERLLSREEFLAEAKGKAVVTPESGLAAALNAAGIACELIPYPDIAFIASLGWERIQSGNTTAAQELDANYIRRSDAEIFSQPKR
ncbi:MAG: tRNA (adenosine(37)-N6)-threonylcarbamoyltransferase complex dimerization subunit type 1 TsaB [Terriglobales bacterium]|jgi:tRNA threonylcarbamoyladenosine biosynthesis protein TsaB